MLKERNWNTFSSYAKRNWTFECQTIILWVAKQKLNRKVWTIIEWQLSVYLISKKLSVISNFPSKASITATYFQHVL